jgi:IclR family transcriptional regulator, acetate operon repressor
MASLQSKPSQEKLIRRTSQETPSIQSLDRGLIILELAGKSSSPVSLGYLTSILGIDRSSVFRLANTLKRRGFLAHASTGKDYVLGPSVWRLSRQYDWSNMLATVAHDHLKALAAVTNETAHLAVREGRSALFIDHAVSTHVISISGQTGEHVPVYCSAHGKALLADFSEGELKSMFGEKPLKAYTRRTTNTIKGLSAVCAEIRKRGYATDDGEYLDGVRCVAAPIRDRDSAVIGSIGISAPISRFPESRYGETSQHVKDCAKQIGALLSAQVD